MKILQINNILYSFGGAEKYLFRLSHLLKSKGHRVAYFSIDYPQNINTKWKKYFPKYIDYEHIGLKNIHKILQGTIYSFEAKIKINKLLNDFQPDVVHLHSIYKYISPSILSEIKKRRIPIIQTVHDYHLLAPSRTLFHDGKICEVTKIYRYYNALLHKCIKKSYIASLISVLSFYIHSILGLYTKNVDYFITPSHFMENKLLQYRFNPKKIIYLPYFIAFYNSQLKFNISKKKYILYFGRLTPEKGLTFLIDVAKNLPDITFKIVGTGYQQDILQKKIKTDGLKNVIILEYQSGKNLERLISKSYITILPSLWFENLPNSILESFSYGKPVLASRIGGIPELVRNGKTGLLFEAGNIKDCINKIMYLWNKPQFVNKMGIFASQVVKTKYNSDIHYHKLIKIYKKVIKSNV